MKFKSLTLSLLSLGLAGSALALELDPGTGAAHFQTNSNDGYSDGRGILFTADASFAVTDAGFFTKFSSDDGFTMTLWTALADGSNLYVSNLGSFTVASPTAGLHYVNGSFSSAINLVAGTSYHLEVTSNSIFDETWFYNWNGPSVDLGDVTIIDGSHAGGLGNTVAPVLQINAVPEPATFAVLGLGAIALLRRKRK